jgi:hypothetical protein
VAWGPHSQRWRPQGLRASPSSSSVASRREIRQGLRAMAPMGSGQATEEEQRRTSRGMPWLRSLATASQGGGWASGGWLARGGRGPPEEMVGSSAARSSLPCSHARWAGSRRPPPCRIQERFRPTLPPPTPPLLAHGVELAVSTTL